jgi:transcriptional regulator with XRE-family HTH domain
VSPRTEAVDGEPVAPERSPLAAAVVDLFGVELSATRLGELLAEARRTAGRTQRDAAADAGISARRLSAYERGRREVPVDVLHALLGGYGVTPAALLRPRTAPRVDVVRRAVWIDGQVRWVRQSRPAAEAWFRHDQILQLFLELVEELRDERLRGPHRVREADRQALARVLELPESVVTARIVELVGCTESDAAVLWRLLRRAPFGAPVVLALLAAGTLAAGTLAVADAAPAGALPAGAPPVVTDVVIDAPPAGLAPPVVTDTVVDAPPAALAPPVVNDVVVDAPPADVVASADGPGDLATPAGVPLTEEMLAVLLDLD